MKSGHVVDTESRTKQLDQFFAQQALEKRLTAETSANKAKSDVLEDAKRDPGKVLSHVEFGRKLAKMNTSLLFEQSVAFPDQGGIYVRQDGANADDLNPQCRNRRFVTGMAWGMVPEHTIISTANDKYGQPQPRVKVKGWRDTLKVLIQMRIVTLAGAERVFGSGGKNWHQQLH